ncbi:MAG: hypothetical protein DLM60_15965 [Pseudonocardiales bacterium]|nr:MAG: hypothetical protein DLM60_15965 [Pseudonocardiales bacterium]
MSREYRALGRELRPGPQIKRRPVWARLVGWVLRHLPEIQLVALLIRVSQLTAAQIGPLWTNTGTPDHGMSVYFGRRRYSAAPLPAVAIESEDLHGAGPVLEVRGVQ